MSHAGNPLQLPLDGIRVVEASAGTGKTFAIATLYLRLILQRGLLPEAIVVSTFTRAAAAELSARLRARVARAEALLEETDPTVAGHADDGETLALRGSIEQALAGGKTLANLRAHIRAARIAMDGALIGTLHGFCFRALDEFGFETGQALVAPELSENIHTLETEIVRDFWRHGSSNAETARLLSESWGDPDTLAGQVCDARWRGRAIDPAPPPSVSHADAMHAAQAVRARIAAWTPATLERAREEITRVFGNATASKSRLRKLEAVHAAACGCADIPAFVTLVDASLGDIFDPAMVEKPWYHGPFQGEEWATLQALATCIADLKSADHAAHCQLLLTARNYLERERPRRLAAHNLMSHDQAIDRLAAALAEPVRGAAVAARMRARWQAALIDEFQDTDTAQWQVLRRLFGDTTLVLVGDPKQSIYGFRGGDVYAWRVAVAASRHARLSLTTSYRAGAGMTRAINALFDRPDAFIEAGFAYSSVAADATVAARAVLHDGEPLAALQVWQFAGTEFGADGESLPGKERVEAGIEAACVAWIVAQLGDAGAQLRDRHGHCTPLRPQHLAVLVNTNAQAQAMQAALTRAGVPASCNLRASVYASDEAGDLMLLLTALAAPDDLRRARAAQASVLVGRTATDLAPALADTEAQASLLQDVAEWALAIQRHGPLAWLHTLIAAAAPRVLGWPDGERRIANYLQLAELLHDLHAASFGCADWAARFQRARNTAHDDADADAARLRLDTDADAVTIATVHSAKGLEYDVVLVPYPVLARNPDGKSSSRPRLRWYHQQNNARVAVGEPVAANINAATRREIDAEEVRKLYVAVTRARALCVLAWGAATSTGYSPLFHLLHQAGRDVALPADAEGCAQALTELRASAQGAVAVLPLPRGAFTRWRAAERALAPPLAARAWTRTDLQRDWRTWSFSRLVRGQANAADSDPAPGTGDAAPTAGAPLARPLLAGPRFGTAVHAALERADYSAWLGAIDVPDSQRALVAACLRAQGLPEPGLCSDEAIRLTGACIAAALNAPLPCGVRAGELASHARRAEMEFHLALAPTSVAELFALLHRHGYQRHRRGVGVETLHGMLTGIIDLVFQHAGRFHLIDWKTNFCPPYDAAAMQGEIATHDYDLQWLLYVLALHRWLRQQWADYDYERHMGDAYYLFVRGLGHGDGLHIDRPAYALIEAMDSLFAPRAEGEA